MMAAVKKTQTNQKNQKTNVGENVEKLEPSCTVGGNVKWFNCCGKRYVGSSKN